MAHGRRTPLKAKNEETKPLSQLRTLGEVQECLAQFYVTLDAIDSGAVDDPGENTEEFLYKMVEILEWVLCQDNNVERMLEASRQLRELASIDIARVD
jgi:hypothetical protein